MTPRTSFPVEIMNIKEKRRALIVAVKAARAAGTLMRRHLHKTKAINSQTRFDIKLELDVRAQRLIERQLSAAFPDVPVLGEEGDTGDFNSDLRWVVDPIDGTVNFSHGIPHACVSIALQQKSNSDYETLIGVIFDPFLNEMWTAVRGQSSKLNGVPIHVSARRRLSDCILTLGFSKDAVTLRHALPVFNRIVYRVRKVRMMGSAALGLAWVAAGRLDAYREDTIRLWDFAAGGLLVECAGGEFWHRPKKGVHTYEMLAHNGHLRRQIEACYR